MLEYDPVVVTLSKLKAQFLTGSNVVKANGMPTLPAIQKSLSEREVFITYFPTITGIGRLCIDKSGATHSAGAFDAAPVKMHARLIELATTASHGPDPGLDSQFPVESRFISSGFCSPVWTHACDPGFTRLSRFRAS